MEPRDFSSATTTATTSATNANTTMTSSSSRRGRKPDHDDISQEQVLRIYQEELAKMMSGASSNFNPVLGGNLNPNLSGLNALNGARAMASNIRDYNRYRLFYLLLSTFSLCRHAKTKQQQKKK